MISWRARHEVHPGLEPAPDFLALEGDRVVGRMFEVTHAGNSGRWFWSVMSTKSGALSEPLCGVEEQQSDAARCVAEAYAQVTPSSALSDLLEELRG